MENNFLKEWLEKAKAREQKREEQEFLKSVLQHSLCIYETNHCIQTKVPRIDTDASLLRQEYIKKHFTKPLKGNKSVLFPVEQPIGTATSFWKSRPRSRETSASQSRGQLSVSRVLNTSAQDVDQASSQIHSRNSRQRPSKTRDLNATIL